MLVCAFDMCRNIYISNRGMPHIHGRKQVLLSAYEYIETFYRNLSEASGMIVGECPAPD